MLAVGLDQDEITSFNGFILAGGKVDDWKWSHEELYFRMGSGKLRESSSGEDPHRKQRNTRDVMDGVLDFFGTTRDVNSGKFTTVNKGSIAEAMGIMGIVPIDVPVDSQGNVQIPHGMIFIPYDTAHEGPTSLTITPPETPSESVPPPFMKRG